MNIKEGLISKIKERLDLTIECGFPKENAEYFLDEVRKVPEERFTDPKEMNWVCNNAIPAFEAYSNCTDDFDCMGPSEWKYYMDIMSSDKHSLTGNKKNDFFNFIAIKKNVNRALNRNVIQAHEARMPLWEYHNSQVPDEPFYFGQHVDMAYRYRQILFNKFLDDMPYKEWYNENNNPENLKKLMDRILNWFVNQPMSYLENTYPSSQVYRIEAIAFHRFGKTGEAERYFKKAFALAKAQKQYSIQERLLEDMKSADIKVPLLDKIRVGASTGLGYF